MHRTRLPVLAILAALPSTALGSSLAVMPADEAAPAAPAAATVSTSSWYLRNEIGGNLIPSISLKDRTVLGIQVSDADLSMDAGVGWNIAFGIKANDLLAFEISSGLSYNTFKSVSGTLDDGVNAPLSGTLDADGHLLQVPILMGPRFEIPVGESLRLNLGASIGGMYLDGELTQIDVLPIAGGGDSSWAFAYSATVGVDWAITPNIAVGAAYRFLGTASASFGPESIIETDGIYNQQVLASVTLRF
jgi:opacity protein-like surface antigen